MDVTSFTFTIKNICPLLYSLLTLTDEVLQIGISTCRNLVDLPMITFRNYLLNTKPIDSTKKKQSVTINLRGMIKNVDKSPAHK